MRTEFNRQINEVKSTVSSILFEKLLPPIKFEYRLNATLESAKRLDSQKGDFLKSADLYHTILETSKNDIERLDARFGLAQQLINLGRFGQAKKFLDSFDMSSMKITSRERTYYSARQKEKLGWIKDYEGDYEGSINNFVIVKNYLENAVRGEMSEDEKKLYATAIHFLGRGHFGLGNYETAIKYFSKHLESPDLSDGDKGFGHAWLARSHMKLGNLDFANAEISLTKIFFENYLQNYPERGIMAHYHLLKGELVFRLGNFTNARQEFEKALEIRYTKERYPKGEADALFGIAGTYWAERNLGAAFIYAIKGFKTYPLSIIKPSI